MYLRSSQSPVTLAFRGVTLKRALFADILGGGTTGFFAFIAAVNERAKKPDKRN